MHCEIKIRSIRTLQRRHAYSFLRPQIKLKRLLPRHGVRFYYLGDSFCHIFCFFSSLYLLQSQQNGQPWNRRKREALERGGECPTNKLFYWSYTYSNAMLIHYTQIPICALKEFYYYFFKAIDYLLQRRRANFEHPVQFKMLCPILTVVIIIIVYVCNSFQCPYQFCTQDNQSPGISELHH